MGYRILVDSFDHDTNEPVRLKGEALDRHVLSTAKRVSIFWITETQARAKRVTAWQKLKQLDLDNVNHGYPWVGVTRFEPK